MVSTRANIFSQLEKEILHLQRFKPLQAGGLHGGLSIIKDAFPNAAFPTGAIHEFFTSANEDNTASFGFIAGIISSLMQCGAPSIWVSSTTLIFPPALKHFGIDPHKMIFISGLRSSNDVMRGEETILAGCDVANSTEEQLHIFPGTHSKHVIIQNGMIKDFKTYMTGEVFQLLSSKSLLASSVEKNEFSFERFELFEQGIKDASSGNLLNNIFHVRTNTLLDVLSKTENYMYLSGLVIGEELKSIAKENYLTINIVSSGPLMEFYRKALAEIGLKNKLALIDADKALIQGQHKILEYIQ